jgi:predicted membrane protein
MPSGADTFQLFSCAQTVTDAASSRVKSPIRVFLIFQCYNKKTFFYTVVHGLQNQSFKSKRCNFKPNTHLNFYGTIHIQKHYLSFYKIQAAKIRQQAKDILIAYRVCRARCLVQPIGLLTFARYVYVILIRLKKRPGNFTGEKGAFTGKAAPFADMPLPAARALDSFEEKNRMERFENAAEKKIVPKHKCSGSFGNMPAHQQRGRVWTGAFLLLIGTAALMRISFDVPQWLFSWQMLLITLGIFMGVRHHFRQGPWFVLILIGSVFMLRDFFPGFIDQRMIWPLILIAVGLFLMIRPRRRLRSPEEHDMANNEAINPGQSIVSTEELLESTSVFGGIKKTILSKNFCGGEIVNIMGGTELNLSQADINGTVVLEVTQIFGGTKIIVPRHWEVKPEMAAIFGGIDDKRYIEPGAVDASKVLLLKGTSVFGGIEVRSY